MIVVIQNEIPNPKKPMSLEDMSEKQIVAYVGKRLSNLSRPAKRRNKGVSPSLVTA